MFKVGEKVVFIGPDYKFGAGGPTVGERGIVTAAEGHTMQAVGGPVEELVTVRFPNHEKEQVVNCSRLKLDA